MKPDDIQARLAQFEALCRQRGLPLTVQRRDILEAVLKRDDHPTADQLYESLVDRLPGLSRTTVYRVLGLLVEVGVVRRLHPSGTATRFDGCVRRHHHLICTRCEKVMDLDNAALDQILLPETDVDGFEIDDFSVHITGTCAECRAREAAGGKRQAEEGGAATDT